MKNANMLEHFIKKYSGNDAKTWKLHHKIKTNNTRVFNNVRLGAHWCDFQSQVAP